MSKAAKATQGKSATRAKPAKAAATNGKRRKLSGDELSGVVGGVKRAGGKTDKDDKKY